MEQDNIRKVNNVQIKLGTNDFIRQYWTIMSLQYFFHY